jgi:TolB-like protein
MPYKTGSRLGPYEILSAIGAGGMGEVYRARDRKLDRDVAVKVLPDAVAADPEALARFEREAKAVAALSHPNILAIHDFGKENGVAYAVMELLEGETLRSKLEARPLSRKQVLEYALQIARGLSAAHEKGVVHRDLKPENLFVTKDGHVKILDFGLAKRVRPAATGEETNAPTVSAHTRPGVVMGTVDYMSPEQVRGLAIDHRSDIFSFGTVLYELFAGAKPFRGATEADTISAILKEEPPEPTSGIPPAIEHVIRHCLEKNREERFQSVKDIAFALSEASGATGAGAPRGISSRPSLAGRGWFLAAAVIVAALGVAGILLLRRFPKGPAAPGSVERLAVLPFENVGSPEDDYFAEGIADEIRGKLTSLHGVEVIARGSSTPYKKTTKTPAEIARELDVRYLLTATVRWQKGAGANRVHVTPELVEVNGSAAPASRWQQPFDAALTDVFQVQSDIATRVAEALGVALAAGEARQLSERPTRNLAAYDAFLKGEEVWRGLAVGDPPGVRKALGFYEQAVALDPGFAQAWARISWGNSSLYRNAGVSPDFATRAKEAAEKAIALAPNRSEGYHALGNYRRLVRQDAEGALKEYEKGRRLAPGNAELLTAIVIAEEVLGRWGPALEHLRESESVDPRSIPTKLRLGEALVLARRYPEARQALDRGLAIAPGNLALIQYKAVSFLGEGDLVGARRAVAAAPAEVDVTRLVAYFATSDLYWFLDEGHQALLVRLAPSAFDDDRGQWGISLAQELALRGDATQARIQAEVARGVFEERVRAAPDDAPNRAALGISLALLGRKSDAVREGERAVALLPVSKDAMSGPYVQHQLARIYLYVGEPEKAIDALEPLLKIPYTLSPAWLRIDPNFDPLRKNPRFERLAARKVA